MTAVQKKQTMRFLQGLAPSLVVLGLFLVLPLCMVLAFSLMTKGDWGGVEPIFTFDAYRKIFVREGFDGSLNANWPLITILLRSIVLAAVTTFLCLLIGFPAAFFIAQQSERMKTILLVAIMIPFWSNLLIRTIAWILILRDNGPLNSALIWTGLVDAPISLLFTNTAVLIGLIYIFIPFMILPIYSSVERLDMSLIEASFDLHADKFRTLTRVILPLAAPGIIAGAILVFIPALGSFVTPDLLGGGKTQMIGGLIKHQFSEAADWPNGSALSAMLLALVLITLFAISKRSHRGDGSL